MSASIAAILQLSISQHSCFSVHKMESRLKTVTWLHADDKHVHLKYQLIGEALPCHDTFWPMSQAPTRWYNGQIPPLKAHKVQRLLPDKLDFFSLHHWMLAFKNKHLLICQKADRSLKRGSVLVGFCCCNKHYGQKQPWEGVFILVY